MQVAITVFWLGKYAQLHYEGPQLDFSAFSDLVNHHQYKSVLQLSPSPSASASRSEDSDSTASSSPRPPAKRSLTLQSVQEDLVQPEFEKNEHFARHDNQSHVDNEPFHNFATNQVSYERSKGLSGEGESTEERHNTVDDQEPSELVIKPPSPFAGEGIYEHNKTSSPTQEQNQKQSLPPISALQDYFYEHRRRPSTDSVGYSSAHGSCYSGESKTPSQSEYLHSPQHVRDNSYDSVLSDDRTYSSSLYEDKSSRTCEDRKGGYREEENKDIMPVRYDVEEKRTNMSANEGKNTSNIRYSATFDAVYDQDSRHDDSGI